MEEREEGEISDSNDDSFGLSYKPVSRPDSTMYRRVERHVPSSDEDYSSDSDSDTPIAAKRKRPNVHKMDTGNSVSNVPQASAVDNGTQETRPIAKARRRNNVWSSVMEEQVLAQEIGGFGLKRRLDQGERSVETYDYLAAQKLLQAQSEHNSEAEAEAEAEEEEDENTKKKRMNRKRHVKERLSYRKSKTKSGRDLVDVEVGDSMTDEEVGLTIAEALMERKPELIVNVVEVLGREKALDLYKSTQEIERDGGMMVVNGSRKRTSGGVYIHLLKNLPTLERADLIKIFPQDEAGSLQQWRKRKRAHRKRERHESKPQGDTVNEEGLHLGELFSDDPGGAKCPGSTPVTSPQPSDTEDQELPGSLINQLSPPRRQDVTPLSPPHSLPSSKTDSTVTSDRPLETYNGGFLNVEVKHQAQNKEETRNQGSEVTYDDDIFDIHASNEDMELF